MQRATVLMSDCSQSEPFIKSSGYRYTDEGHVTYGLRNKHDDQHNHVAVCTQKLRSLFLGTANVTLEVNYAYEDKTEREGVLLNRK